MKRILICILLPLISLYCMPQTRNIYHGYADDYQHMQSLVAMQNENGAAFDYLIITADSLVDSFIPLRDWKRQKGIRAEIWPLSFLNEHFPWATSSMPFLIKTGIRYAYEFNHVKWVLLGGDDNIIPARDCYGVVVDVFDCTIPCDLYYACLDDFSYYENSTFNWNDNENDKYGEIADNIDLDPEVYISRIPVRNSNQINAVVSKTLSYEQNPQLLVRDTMLLVGVKFGAYYDYSDSHRKSEQMYSQYIAFQNSEWTGCRLRFYDTGTDFPGGASYDVTALNLSNQINHGYSYIHVASHGEYDRWTLEGNNSFCSSDASSLSGSISPVIVTTACNTNAFDHSGICLSEALIRNRYGGCVAFLGSSRFGWGFASPNLNSQDASYYYNASFFQSIMNHTGNKAMTFAEAVAYAKSQYINYSESYGAYRWLQFSLNAIGDPELPMYTCSPDSFTNVTVSYSGTDITVSTGGISGCCIALTSTDAGDSYFEVVDNSSSATFENVLCPFNLVITKRNYVPFRFHQPDVYIQNHTFQSDAAIGARNIIAGKNVIPSATNGNVIISNGNAVSFDIDGYSYIKGGFEVKGGAQLQIH